MRRGPPLFPNVWQALLLLVALFLAEVLISAGLRDARAWLGLSDDALDALATLLGNGVVLAIATGLTTTSYKELLHPSHSSAKATAVLLFLPVLALVPGLLLLIGSAVELVAALVPLSSWEEAMFARFASNSLPMVVSICVLAPVLEEMLFRGVILRGFLSRFPRGQAIWASALLFGVAHLNLYQFVSAVAIGLLLGWLYERSQSLIPCIFLHGGFNTAVTFLQAGHDTTEASLPSNGEVWLVSLALAAIGAWALRAIFRPPAETNGLADESVF